MTDIVAGVDLGGTAINYTFADDSGRFLLDGLCEHPARAAEGPSLCLGQIVDGLAMAAQRAGVPLSSLRAVGLDTPGPASAKGVLSAKGSTNFVHPEWAGFDLATNLASKLGVAVTYLNDGNAAALWGHFAFFGVGPEARAATSITAVIGTGLGGGIVIDGRAISGKNGFGGELGHVLVPFERIGGLDGLQPRCNCGRFGDLESLCSLTAIANSLLPFFLEQHPGHELAGMSPRDAAKRVRGLAESGDPMCRAIFRVQARSLGLFFDQMINTFDPDALFVGGGALETREEFQRWFIDEIRAGMPAQRAEQADIPIKVMPNGDTAGARGAAIEALKLL
jgi:glucokinase